MCVICICAECVDVSAEGAPGGGRESRPEIQPSIQQWRLVLFQSLHTDSEKQTVSNSPQTAKLNLWSHSTVCTYFNYFQGCWVKAFALLHNFAMDGFVNLVPYNWETHNVVLNFCKTNKEYQLTNEGFRFTKENKQLQVEFLTLHCAFFLLKRDLLVDNPFGALNGNFLKVVYSSLLWTLQPRSCHINSKYNVFALMHGRIL